MIDRQYKSILNITGVRLPTAVEALKSGNKEVIVEEQFQVVYIMYYLEKRSHVHIAKTLSMTTYKVRKLLTSYICNMMKLFDWNPMYRCSNRDVAQEDNCYVFEYADLAEIEAKLDSYEKNNRKDAEWK